MGRATSTKSKKQSFKIYCPSFKRADQVCTQDYLPDCVYVVGEFEKDEYLAAGHRIVAVPDKFQGSVCRIRNWILDNSEMPDRTIIMDDDIKAIGRWCGNERKDLDTDEAMEFIESGFILAEGFGVKYWGLNCIQDKGSYREYTPFSMKSFIGGPFGGFINLDLRYDESLPLKEDYDLTIQVLAKYRKVLRINFAHYWAKQHINTGGCADYRTIDKERQQLDALQKKWGSKIVRKDSGKSQVNRKKKVTYDINPIIRVPIGGI